MNQVAAPSHAGSFRLLHVAGIDVFVHWTWLLVAYFGISARSGVYSSLMWNIAEYLSLFGIVLLHEFGHALACRQVGGTADRIMLWPLGGIAYVNPPARPGAFLWSIAAGPLVNVVLLPITVFLLIASAVLGGPLLAPDANMYLTSIAVINGALLVFNLLPIYPLDGGQIVQALLWFVLGRARSLTVVCALGLVTGIALIGLSLWSRDWWFAVLAFFMASRCWAGFGQARMLKAIMAAPRRVGYACPSCGIAPLAGAFWMCGQCRRPFDLLSERGVCPGCAHHFPDLECFDCRHRHAIAAWLVPTPTNWTS